MPEENPFDWSIKTSWNPDDAKKEPSTELAVVDVSVSKPKPDPFDWSPRGTDMTAGEGKPRAKTKIWVEPVQTRIEPPISPPVKPINVKVEVEPEVAQDIGGVYDQLSKNKNATVSSKPITLQGEEPDNYRKEFGTPKQIESNYQAFTNPSGQTKQIQKALDKAAKDLKKQELAESKARAKVLKELNKQKYDYWQTQAKEVKHQQKEAKAKRLVQANTGINKAVNTTGKVASTYLTIHTIPWVKKKKSRR